MARYTAAESIGLEFVAGLQHLPHRERAVLLLSDVAGFSTVEVAAMLESSEPAVNRVLQLARSALDARLRRLHRGRAEDGLEKFGERRGGGLPAGAEYRGQSLTKPLVELSGLLIIAPGGRVLSLDGMGRAALEIRFNEERIELQRAGEVGEGAIVEALLVEARRAAE